MIPLLFAFIIASAIPGAETYAFIAMYGFFLVTIIDCVILGSIVTKKITARSGEGSVQKGTRLYAAMRAVQLRPMRLPKPQVKRGNYPE